MTRPTPVSSVYQFQSRVYGEIIFGCVSKSNCAKFFGQKHSIVMSGRFTLLIGEIGATVANGCAVTHSRGNPTDSGRAAKIFILKKSTIHGVREFDLPCDAYPLQFLARKKHNISHSGAR